MATGLKASENDVTTIKIADRAIGPTHPPYIIAELSANHNGRLDTALRIVEEARKAGADAVRWELLVVLSEFMPTCDKVTRNNA